jgi:hypothetical protein
MNEKTIDELMERRSQIAEEMNAEGADLNALESEVRSINEELENRKKAEAEREEKGQQDAARDIEYDNRESRGEGQHRAHGEVNLTGQADKAHSQSYSSDDCAVAENIHHAAPGKPRAGDCVYDKNYDQYKNETVF